ncbi:hypothetical protein GPJ56_007695 [Histomonas meleagridis]|uniref:uncharacterized protein n=1 Tax=Histomonas meleagridis TaxID=135588 RepID=UPI003559ABB3|nr:hypothetical protein GPJ56_007695 [Histomonas meleagridis]KAH0805888.1 hypothetical protein GO595_001322 [Histomonas meleagridis]
MSFEFTIQIPSYQPLKRKYPLNSTVRTIREDIRHLIKTNNFQLTQKNQVLKDATPLKSLQNRIPILVQYNHDMFHYSLPSGEISSLPVRPNTSVSETKSRISARLHLPVDRVILNRRNQTLQDPMLVHSISSSPRDPINVQIIADNHEKTKYFIMMQGEAYCIYLDNDATVETAIKELSKWVNIGTKSIRLQYDGRILRSNFVLKNLSLSKDDYIIAETEMEEKVQIIPEVNRIAQLEITPVASESSSSSSESDSSKKSNASHKSDKSQQSSSDKSNSSDQSNHSNKSDKRDKSNSSNSSDKSDKLRSSNGSIKSAKADKSNSDSNTSDKSDKISDVNKSSSSSRSSKSGKSKDSDKSHNSDSSDTSKSSKSNDSDK